MPHVGSAVGSDLNPRGAHRWGLCAAVCLAAVGAQTPNPSAAKFNSMIAAETALVEAVWGNSEEYITHSRSRVPPYHFDAATGASGPVRVDISVLVEKIKIDTVSQVATIKWWLRQSWKDQRLAWNTAAYTYGKGDQTGFVGSVNRRPGPEGGTWTPDLVLWYIIARDCLPLVHSHPPSRFACFRFLGRV